MTGMNRRDMVKRLSLLGAAAVVPPGWPALADGLQSRAALPCAVVHDGRYAAARRFARVLGARGVARLSTTGEILTLWNQQCRPRLAGRAWVLIGLTTYSDFAIARSCARSSGATPLYEGMHDFRRAGKIMHTLRAGNAGEAIARALRHEDWTAGLARALMRARWQGEVEAASPWYTEGGLPAPDHPGTLVSWVIGRD